MSGSRRRWFRIHLSTAVVMMLIVAILIFLNMRSLWGQNEKDIVNWLPESELGNPVNWEYGWPMKAYQYVPSGNLIDADCFRPRFSWTPALLDGAVAVLTIATVSILCESLARRREARKS
jgi:hypothetical protein